MNAPRFLLPLAGLAAAFVLTACDQAPSTQAPDPGAAEVVPVPPPVDPAPDGHAEVWARYLELNSDEDPAEWVINGGGLAPVHLDAMRVNLKTTYKATGWALARSADGSRYKLVTEFSTSGDALRMLTTDPAGRRYNTLAAFDPPTDTVIHGSAQLADDLLNAALTRLNVVRAQSEAYAASHDGKAPDISENWRALTRTTPPLLTTDPINPLTGSTRVAAIPGPDVGWVDNGISPLRLSVPAKWVVAYPQLADDAAPF